MKITPEFINDPFPVYRTLRQTGRMHWSEANGGTWIFPCYEDVREFLKCERFSAQMKAEHFVNQFPEEIRPDYSEFSRFVKMWIVLLDGAKHDKLRRLMNRGFTPRFIDIMRPKIQAIADELVANMQGKQEVDFMEVFAKPFPAKVIAAMLGVGDENYRDFTEWADAIVEFTGSLGPTVEMLDKANHGLFSMMEFFRAEIPFRRNLDTADLIGLLIQIEENGDLLTEEEVISNCGQLVFAGHETTRNLVSTGLYALLQNQEQFAKLKAQPELMRNATREMMRFTSPLQMVKRVAQEDCEIYGNNVKKNQGIILLLQSANRDEQKFADPDRFDIERDNAKDNLALGFGPHVCLGATLAYLEAEIAFATLFRAFPNMRLTDTPPVYNANPFLRGFSSLQLRLVD
ncbi:cytochrome P450 [Cellvibrio sp. KY-GH-1]|uniref:cytochrome P450 n=1 Tax=Cellvibrio sp. KY-GH-1 TaxID=2303332 RepID=UPI00177BACCF|nr:cytochrome P450 [Cellvibrio sp. KY-GH-1]